MRGLTAGEAHNLVAIVSCDAEGLPLFVGEFGATELHIGDAFLKGKRDLDEKQKCYPYYHAATRLLTYICKNNCANI